MSSVNVKPSGCVRKLDQRPCQAKSCQLSSKPKWVSPPWAPRHSTRHVREICSSEIPHTPDLFVALPQHVPSPLHPQFQCCLAGLGGSSSVTQGDWQSLNIEIGGAGAGAPPKSRFENLSLRIESCGNSSSSSRDNLFRDSRSHVQP